MSAMNTKNQEGPAPNNSANPARDLPEAFVEDDTPASANHLVVRMGGSRNTSSPNSSGTSSSGLSSSTSPSITHAASKAVRPQKSSGGTIRQTIVRSIQSTDHPSHWPQPSTSAMPPSSVNQQQHPDFRPGFAQYHPNHFSCQPSRHSQSATSLALPSSSGAQHQHPVYRPNLSQSTTQPSYAPTRQPQPHTFTAEPPILVDQLQHPVHRPNLPQCSTQPSYHPNRQPEPAAHSTLPQSFGGQYRSHISNFWEWAKVKTFEEAMEDIEKNQRNKVIGRELTKEEKLWNKAVLHTLENKEIYFNRHLAGKPPNWDRYLFPGSLFNPFGEHAKMPQEVTKPPRPINVFKRAQRLVGADKFPGNKVTREQCKKWAKMLKTEHNLQIGLGFIVPRQMRAMKNRQVGEAVQMDYGLEDMDSDNDDEPSTKIVRMTGNYGDDNNDNNGGDERDDIN